MNRRRNPEVTYTLGTTEYRLTGEGRDPVIHVRRRGGDFYVLPASSLGPREYARVFREWANVTKRRNPAAGWTFTIAPSPGQRVRAKRIVSLWNGTMVGNVATFETATEARLAASQMDDDGIRWTRSNPRRRNPATAGDDVTKPYPWAKKEAEYQSWQMGPQQLREARDEAMRSRDQADATAKPSQTAAARSEAALKAAQKAHAAAQAAADRDYAIYGWHADDVSTIAQERKRRLESAKSASASEIAALSNPRRRNPAEVNTDGLPPRAPRGHVRIYTVNGGDMMETPTRRFDNQFDAVAHATRTGRPYFVVEDVSKERARRYGVG